MTIPSLRVALASPRFAPSLAQGVDAVRRYMCKAASAKAHLVCFPESYLPGIRGQEFAVPPHDQREAAEALDAVCETAREARIAAIVPMDWEHRGRPYNVAVVVSETGEVLGCQTKNQIPPEEERFYVPGGTRRLFSVRGVPFGIVICHEGWRYPETVRWAAVRGARIVFHPFYAGSDRAGPVRRAWGEAGAPFYENAMRVRSLENTIYFASVNYGLRYPEAATTLVSPAGECVGHVPYGQEGMVVRDLDLTLATGLLASRYRPERYRDAADADAVLA